MHTSATATSARPPLMWDGLNQCCCSQTCRNFMHRGHEGREPRPPQLRIKYLMQRPHLAQLQPSGCIWWTCLRCFMHIANLQRPQQLQEGLGTSSQRSRATGFQLCYACCLDGSQVLGTARLSISASSWPSFQDFLAAPKTGSAKLAEPADPAKTKMVKLQIAMHMPDQSRADSLAIAVPVVGSQACQLVFRGLDASCISINIMSKGPSGSWGIWRSANSCSMQRLRAVSFRREAERLELGSCSSSRLALAAARQRMIVSSCGSNLHAEHMYRPAMQIDYSQLTIFSHANVQGNLPDIYRH